jgi:hypothetical protein
MEDHKYEATEEDNRFWKLNFREENNKLSTAVF